MRYSNSALFQWKYLIGYTLVMHVAAGLSVPFGGAQRYRQEEIVHVNHARAQYVAQRQ